MQSPLVIYGDVGPLSTCGAGRPSILLLLLLSFGICVGPVLAWIDPDESFGESLPPFVSLSAVWYAPISIQYPFSTVRRGTVQVRDTRGGIPGVSHGLAVNRARSTGKRGALRGRAVAPSDARPAPAATISRRLRSLANSLQESKGLTDTEGDGSGGNSLGGTIGVDCQDRRSLNGVLFPVRMKEFSNVESNYDQGRKQFRQL